MDEIEKKYISIMQNNSKKKIANKRMRIKIEIQDKFYFLLKSETKKKNQFNKRKKKYINKKIMIKNETKSKSKIFIERLN